MRAWRRRWHLVSPTLYIIIVYTVNLNKLSRNFVGALRTTTTNCRVSFIDLYLVFPRNFRMIFLPHTNTVILLEPYCGTITIVCLNGIYVFVVCFWVWYFIAWYRETGMFEINSKLLWTNFVSSPSYLHKHEWNCAAFSFTTFKS